MPGRRKFLDEPKQPPFAKRGARVPRIGAVTSVNETNATVDIKWLDVFGGGRTEVPITQSNSGDFSFPTKDDLVICVADEYETPHIVRFVKTNYEGRVETGEARQIYQGERIITSIGGANIYLTQRGSILIQDPVGDEIIIDRSTGSITTQSINYQATTEAGIIKAGLIKRLIPDATLGEDVNTVIENASSEALTEYVVKVYEVADLEVGIDDTQDPIVTLTMGTVVADDSAGTKTLSSEGEEICIDISTKSSVGFRLLVDKAGNLEVVTKKVKITSTDIDVTADTVVVNTDDSDSIQFGGTNGDHLATKDFVRSIYDGHTHSYNKPVHTITDTDTDGPDPSSNSDSYTDKTKAE